MTSLVNTLICYNIKSLLVLKIVSLRIYKLLPCPVSIYMCCICCNTLAIKLSYLSIILTFMGKSLDCDISVIVGLHVAGNVVSGWTLLAEAQLGSHDKQNTTKSVAKGRCFISEGTTLQRVPTGQRKVRQLRRLCQRHNCCERQNFGRA